METVYIETSIVSYLVADRSRHLITAGNQQATRDWWQQRRGQFACVVSQEVLLEAGLGDPEPPGTGSSRSWPNAAPCLHSDGIDGRFTLWNRVRFLKNSGA